MTEIKETTKRSYSPSGQYDGKSAEVRREGRKALLLETGIALIGQEGFAAVSLNRLCAQAGLTKRYFYESFDTMESLLGQAFHLIFAELKQDLIQQIASKPTPRGMIEAALEGFYRYLQRYPERGRVFLIEALCIPVSRQQFFDEEEISAVLLLTSRQFMRQAPPPDPVLNVMAQSAVGAARFVGQKWIASGYQQPIHELVAGVSELCFGLGERMGIDLDKPIFDL